MELIEITGLFEMDTGAPSPTIISTDNELFITFYADKESIVDMPQQRNTIYNTGIYILKFNGYLKYTFGVPNDETIHGHPYYKLGMGSYSFYELKNSDLIKQLEEINKVHPYYNPDRWMNYKHYIITFHDNMFECVAEEFEIREESTSIYHSAGVILNEIFTKSF